MSQQLAIRRHLRKQSTELNAINDKRHAAEKPVHNQKQMSHFLKMTFVPLAIPGRVT